MVKQKLVGNWFSLESISHDILWLIFKFLYFILSFMLRRVAYFLHFWKLTNITSNNILYIVTNQANLKAEHRS